MLCLPRFRARRKEQKTACRENGIIRAMGMSGKKQNAAVGEIVVENFDRNDDVRQVVSLYGPRRVVVKCIMPTRK